MLRPLQLGGQGHEDREVRGRVKVRGRIMVMVGVRAGLGFRSGLGFYADARLTSGLSSLPHRPCSSRPSSLPLMCDFAADASLCC